MDFWRKLGDRNNQGDLVVGEKLDDGKKQKNNGNKYFGIEPDSSRAVAIELNMAKYILKNEFDILPFLFL